MIINNPNAPFIPPFNPFIVPSSFYDSWSQEEQIVYLAENKQGRLIPGTGVYIVDNGDGTYTISSDGGTGEGHTYEVRAVAHPSEGNVAEYKLIDLLTGEQSGVTITVPDVNGIASIVTQQSASKAIVTINMTNGTSKSFDVYYGQDGQDGVSPSITVRDITGGHQIEIVSASGTETFNVMDGTSGETGATPNISVSGSVLPMGSSALPVVTVTKTGTPENPNFDFLFANLKGQPGPVGPTPNITVTDITGGHRIVIVSGSGTQTFDVMDGADGDDGYSPTVIVTPISGGHHVAISTVEGTEEFDVMDGAPGATGATPNITVSGSILPIASSALPVVSVTKTGTPENPNFDFLFANLKGQPGPDGISPTVTVRDITGGHQIEIVSAGGTESFDVMDGTDGTDGTDGVSPTITVRDITGGHQIEIVSAGGVERFDVMDGTTPNITITASVLPISGSVQPMSPSVTVTKTGTDEHPNFDFEFEGLGGGGDSLPSGGTKGQVLGINSESPRELGWTDQYPKITASVSGGYLVKFSEEPGILIFPFNKVKFSNLNITFGGLYFTFDLTNVSDTTIEANTLTLVISNIEGTGISEGHGELQYYSYDITNVGSGLFGGGLYMFTLHDKREMSPGQTFSYEIEPGSSSTNITGISDTRFIRTEPAGGTTGQVLTKNSNNDFDFIWSNPSGGVDYIDWIPVPEGIQPNIKLDVQTITLDNDDDTDISYANSAITLSGCSIVIDEVPYNFDMTITPNDITSAEKEWVYKHLWPTADSETLETRYEINANDAVWPGLIPCTINISNPSLSVVWSQIFVTEVNMYDGWISIDWDRSMVGLEDTNSNAISADIPTLYGSTPSTNSFKPDDTSHLETFDTSQDYCLGPKTIE